MGRNLFPQIDRFNCFGIHKFIVWVLLTSFLNYFSRYYISPTDRFFTLFTVYFFIRLIWYWHYAATSTTISLVVSGTGQSSCVLFVLLINSYSNGDTYIQLTSFVNHFIVHNIYWFCHYRSKEVKFLLFFGDKVVS